MTRKRSVTGEARERAWWRRRRELYARDAAGVPPRPDPRTQPREFAAWVEAHAWRKLPPEWQQLMDKDMRQLPGLKYRRARDREVWGWLLLLLEHHGEPYLRTCRLGANPNERRPNKLLQGLVQIVAQEYPDVTARRLFDAIRYWRKARARIEQLK